MKLSQLFNLPNALTLINLFSGCMAVVFVFNYHIDWVPYCISISLVADFLDGFAARWTKTSSDIGKQLDSLADVISFGLLPGAVVYFMILQIMERNSNASLPIAYLIAYSAVAFLITLFAALRLAKFNVDERQSDGFIGLATPAATIFVWGVLEVFLHNTFGLGFIVQSVPFLYAVTALLSVLMIAELPMFAFKFKHYGWSGNEIRYLFIILSVVLLAVFNFASLSIIIILYILISIAQKFIKS
jgi:CDP-diacylglycerol--serine O-phosphatidyltransferase